MQCCARNDDLDTLSSTVQTNVRRPPRGNEHTILAGPYRFRSCGEGRSVICVVAQTPYAHSTSSLEIGNRPLGIAVVMHTQFFDDVLQILAQLAKSAR